MNVKMIQFLLVAALLVSVAQASWSAEKSDRFVQDRFAIGFWVDPPAKEITNARYKEIADANFTFVLGVFGPQNDKDIAKQIALCQKYGLKAIVKGDFTKPETLPEGPAVWGYYLGDEPGVGSIPGIKAQVDAVRKHRPGKLAYLNLLPNYANGMQLGTPSYDDYIARYARETGFDVLCMDYYPQMTPTADGRDGYCSNLEVMRKYSLEQHIPFWNFFNTMPFHPHHDPTESHIRWQIYTSLAYGAKGVLYFCYWTPPSGPGEFYRGGGIISEAGVRGPHYEHAKRINAGLKNLGPTLMKLTSIKVIRIKPTDDPAKALEGAPLKNLFRGGDYLIGIFKHADGRRAVLINNYDPNYVCWPNVVEFDVPDKDVIEVDAADGKEKPVRDDSPYMKGIQIRLDAGEGRLFLLPSKSAK